MEMFPVWFQVEGAAVAHPHPPATPTPLRQCYSVSSLGLPAGHKGRAAVWKKVSDEAADAGSREVTRVASRESRDTGGHPVSCSDG